MEDLYSIHPGISRGGTFTHHHCNDSDYGTTTVELEEAPVDLSDDSDLIKTCIASHPRYPSLVSAYIACRKVGAPPEVASLLDEIVMESGSGAGQGTTGYVEIGTDPELDQFMESYCQVLTRYKEALSRPVDEATSFLTKIESQLSELCKTTTTTAATTATMASATTTATNTGKSLNAEADGISDAELSCEEVEAPESQQISSQLGEQELKEMLLRKYSGYLSSLRKDFLKKRKKGKLPKNARLMLLDWWNTHYRWPYPTDEEKTKLAEAAGLDQKQINNWFINQRKRHWKPSEDMRYALMEGVSGGTSGTTLYFDTGTIGP